MGRLCHVDEAPESKKVLITQKLPSKWWSKVKPEGISYSSFLQMGSDIG